MNLFFGDGPRPFRAVAHVDMDAFYASVEVRENPALGGLPVIVGGDPKSGRGIVTTASYEARRFGVKSAMPIAHAHRLCPHAVYLRPRFHLYEAASRRVFDVLRRHAAVVEAASIDEAYLDLTSRVATVGEAADVARAVQREIWEREALPASVGVAPSKLVAKVASDVRKPRGLTVVRAGEERAFLAPLPARKLPGVGPKTEQALLALGIATCADLAAVPPTRLLDLLGTWGPRLGEMARGLDDAPVVEAWERKSAGAETTFEDEADPDAWRGTLDDLAREAATALRAEGLSARSVTIKVRTAGFETFTRARTLAEPISDDAVIARVALDLLDANLPTEPLRLLGVRLTHLTTRKPTRQESLAQWPADVLGEAEGSWEPEARGLDRFARGDGPVRRP